MATVTGLTSARMLEIEAASVIDGDVVGDNLILTKHDGSTINAGNVRGPQGEVGPVGSPPRVTSLTPGVGGIPNPVPDGFEVQYEALAAEGILWHLKYNSGSASAFKWEFVGGSDLYHQIDTAESRAVLGYGDLATVGPTVTPPISGDYMAEYGAEAWNDTTSAVANIAPAYNGGVASNTDRMSWTEPDGGSRTSPKPGSRSRRFTLTGGQAFTLKYERPSGATAYFRMRWVRLRPIRLVA